MASVRFRSAASKLQTREPRHAATGSNVRVRSDFNSPAMGPDFNRALSIAYQAMIGSDRTIAEVRLSVFNPCNNRPIAIPLLTAVYAPMPSAFRCPRCDASCHEDVRRFIRRMKCVLAMLQTFLRAAFGARNAASMTIRMRRDLWAPLALVRPCRESFIRASVRDATCQL